MTANLSIPIFHTHSPYIERKDVHVHVRAGLLALLTVTVLAGSAVLGWAVLPQVATSAEREVVQWTNAKVVHSPSIFPRETPRYDHMYAPGAETWSVDHMYAKRSR